MRHEFSPNWAPHIKGWYEDREVVDGEPQEAPVGATCGVCKDSFKRLCLSGLMRQHIVNFARAHAHNPNPLAQEKKK